MVREEAEEEETETLDRDSGIREFERWAQEMEKAGRLKPVPTTKASSDLEENHLQRLGDVIRVLQPTIDDQDVQFDISGVTESTHNEFDPRDIDNCIVALTEKVVELTTTNGDLEAKLSFQKTVVEYLESEMTETVQNYSEKVDELEKVVKGQCEILDAGSWGDKEKEKWFLYIHALHVEKALLREVFKQQGGVVTYQEPVKEEGMVVGEEDDGLAKLCDNTFTWF